ncbi:hypothetical protein MRB53_004285 [Persea americana]|uniref:Uncharacterized protein n=1 Tax=Persea americana TaxID=3435 RepID=A0ACC2M9T5_PERAE|nr:hypothetical protein MRB53_004285 [Persea americana]
MKAAAASGSAALGGCAAVARSGFRGVAAACVWRKKMGVRVCARVLRWRVMGAATNLEEGDGEKWGERSEMMMGCCVRMEKVVVMKKGGGDMDGGAAKWVGDGETGLMRAEMEEAA